MLFFCTGPNGGTSCDAQVQRGVEPKKQPKTASQDAQCATPQRTLSRTPPPRLPPPRRSVANFGDSECHVCLAFLFEEVAHHISASMIFSLTFDRRGEVSVRWRYMCCCSPRFRDGCKIRVKRGARTLSVAGLIPTLDPSTNQSAIPPPKYGATNTKYFVSCAS